MPPFYQPETWQTWITTTTTNTKPLKFTQFTQAQTKVWDSWQVVETPVTTFAPKIPAPRSERDELIARNRQRSREVRRRNARRRARSLLAAHLTPEQRAEWEEGSFFHVETANGRRRYRIDKGYVGNIRVVHCEEAPPVKADRVREGTRLCAHAYHPDGWIPDEDHMLAQKLLLESEGGEAELLQMANVL